jgi:hypothetical protein
MFSPLIGNRPVRRSGEAELSDILVFYGRHQ